jgi:hypothetical protein
VLRALKLIGCIGIGIGIGIGAGTVAGCGVFAATDAFIAAATETGARGTAASGAVALILACA